MRWQFCSLLFEGTVWMGTQCVIITFISRIDIHLIVNQNGSRKIINNFFPFYRITWVHLDLIVSRRLKNYVIALWLKVFCHIKCKIYLNTLFNISTWDENSFFYNNCISSISISLVELPQSYRLSSQSRNHSRRSLIIKKIETIKRINYTHELRWHGRDKIAWKTVTVSA